MADGGSPVPQRTYEKEGRVSAPAIWASAILEFDKKGYRLPGTFARKIWQGWIYVTLIPMHPGRDAAQRSEPEVARYGFPLTFRWGVQDHVWKTNWKTADRELHGGLSFAGCALKRPVGAWMPIDIVGFRRMFMRPSPGKPSARTRTRIWARSSQQHAARRRMALHHHHATGFPPTCMSSRPTNVGI